MNIQIRSAVHGGAETAAVGGEARDGGAGGGSPRASDVRRT